MTSNEPIPYEPDGTAGSLEMLTAALRQDAADLELYAAVLTNTLADAFPPGSVTVERKRSMSDRLAGREGRVERLEVGLGEQRLSLTVAHGRVSGEICREVRGVVLSRRPAALDEWVAQLASAVSERAASDARARAALERLIMGGS
jgi:hypothetical protein